MIRIFIFFTFLYIGFIYTTDIISQKVNTVKSNVQKATLCSVMIFAKPIVSSFRADDALLIEIAVTALRFQALTLPAMSFIIITNMYLQNTKNTAFATILAISRQGVLFILVLMILSNTLGILGIQLSQPIADVLTFIISIPLSIISFKALNKQ